MIEERDEVELLVDGYNVLHGVPEWRSLEKQSLGEARSQLEQRLAAYKAKHPEVGVLVYWDGDRDVARLGPRRIQGVSVVFTQSSADGAIIGRVQAARSPGQVAVVTNDRALAKAVEEAGGKVVPVDRLWRWLNGTRDGRGRAEKPRPDTGVGKSITDDLKDVWGA